MLCAVMAVAAGAAAQFGSRGGLGYVEPNVEYDGRFVFSRLRYLSNSAWNHDYPRGDRHLERIVAEVTHVPTHTDGSNVFRLDDPELFKHPIAYLSEPGFWDMSDEEAASLRAYLLKGGFLIFDDFRGGDWYNFEEQLHRVLPDARLVQLDVSAPVFHSFFDIESLDFVQLYDRDVPVFFGVFEDNDPGKRLMVVANYNNDIGEYWEFSDTGYVAIDLSNEAYKFGVNYVIYAMTH